MRVLFDTDHCPLDTQLLQSKVPPSHARAWIAPILPAWVFGLPAVLPGLEPFGDIFVFPGLVNNPRDMVFTHMMMLNHFLFCRPETSLRARNKDTDQTEQSHTNSSNHLFRPLMANTLYVLSIYVIGIMRFESQELIL